MSNEFTFDYPTFGLITQSTLESYATNFLKVPIDVKNKMSWLFLADLYFCHNDKGINPYAVLDEIYILEGLTTMPTGTKKRSPFKGKVLQGLWHQHYKSGCFMAKNIVNTFGKEGNERLTKIITRHVAELDSCDEKSIDTVVDGMIHEIVNDSLKLRKNKNKLTGEWIIFAKYDEQNYYLCMSSHMEEDQLIANRIRAGSLPQFDFIKFGC